MNRERLGLYTAVAVTALLLVWVGVLGLRFYAGDASSGAATIPAGPLRSPMPTSSPSGPSTEALTLPAHPRVLLIGDSWSAGTGVAPAKALPALLGRALGWVVRTVPDGAGSGYAVPGSSGTLDQRLVAAKVVPDVDLVLVQAGGADVTGGISAGDVATDAQTLVSQVRQSYPHAEVLVLGPATGVTPASGSSTGSGAAVVAIDDALRTVCATNRVAYVSPIARGWFTGAVPGRFLKGADLTARGQQLVAGRLERAVKTLTS